jgi:hypothetical protein
VNFIEQPATYGPLPTFNSYQYFKEKYLSSEKRKILSKCSICARYCSNLTSVFAISSEVFIPILGMKKMRIREVR